MGLKRRDIITIAVMGMLALGACSIDFDEPYEKRSVLSEWIYGSAGYDYDVAALSTPGGGRWRVVIMPGAPSANRYWDRVLEQADPNHEYIAIERPGYGKVGPKKPVLEFDEQVAAVLPLISDGKRECLVLVGQSYSATLALKAVIENAEEIDALVIVSGLIKEPSKGTLRLAGVAAAPVINFVTPRWAKTAIAELRGRRDQIDSVFERVNEITVPTIIIHGAKDERVPVSDAELLRRMLPENVDPELLIVEDGNHFISFEQPLRVIGAIEQAITKAEVRGECSADG